ncbi:MAG: glycoside hydrolase family 38 C-terminal domain-containing protein [Actinomycetaceae bacterium]|nr:glycoside hydrolase family 38 C-terminal domain-containing protein [Actinomycetaceae bacterium]
MHAIDSLTLDRIDRLLKLVKERIYTDPVPVTLRAWEAPGEPVSFDEAKAQEFVPFELGSPWGKAWSTWWFTLTFTVNGNSERPRELLIDPGFIGDWPGNQSEGLLRLSDGTILKAVNPQNYAWRIPSDMTGEVTVYFEAAANPDIMAKGWVPTNQGDRLTSSDDALYTFTRAEVATFNHEAWDLYFDLEVLHGLARNLDPTSTRRAQIVAALDRAASALNPANVLESADRARQILRPELERHAASSAHHLHAIGHAHIDCAWLWPLRETVRKTARTFSNVLWLAEQYPDFRFACSSAQQYRWVKDHYPELMGRIKDAVARGQWVPVGGMWVEPDGNLPSGEALVRQLLLGQKLFLEEFGQRCEGMWIPDSFGYTAAYPQIAAQAEMQWFLTQKISWNQTNKFPHHSFWWEGLDGTRLFTHFCPVDCYDSVVEPKELLHAQKNFMDKGRASHSLLPFGHGDGGGGPMRAMMERLHRSRDLDGLPTVTIDTPSDFFATAMDEYADDAQTWVGELYLELHRGTFTSEASIKFGNRRCEAALHAAEYLWSVAAIRAGATYPNDQLNEWWREVLLLQFHDILPGSSIAWVHREAREAYQRLLGEINQSIGDAVAAAGFAGTGHKLNISPASRRLPAASSISVTAPYSTTTRDVTCTQNVTRDGNTVSNGVLTVRFNSDGTIGSIIDEEKNREIIGQDANLFVLHSDIPNMWDAWDVDRFYLESRRELRDLDSFEWVEDSDACTARIHRRFNDSTITQTVTIRPGSRWIDFEQDIDWHEKEVFLKWEFPTTLHAPASQAEIQFGHVNRPTHENTSWEDAKFELYAHRWLRIAEPNYGVSIANDGTYGYDVRRSVVDGTVCTTPRLSVLRGPQFPDPTGDPGIHRRRWSVGVGTDTSEAIESGYALNCASVEVGAEVEPLFRVEGEGVYLETVKLAEDGSGDVIVRAYEALGNYAHARITPTFEVADAYATNIYEEPSSVAPSVSFGDGSAHVRLSAFKFVTIRFVIS